MCLCLCARSACTPPLLAGVCGVGVCAWARVLAAPCPSWLGCWGVCVFVCALCLYPATPGWGVRCGSVCLGSGFGCAPPLPAWVSGCVCAHVRPPLVPRHSTLAFVVCGFDIAWHLFLCLGSLLLVCAARVCGTRWPLLLGTRPCALVVAGGVPLWHAWWPRVVRCASSGPVALGPQVGFPDAVVPFPCPGACAPGFPWWLRKTRGVPAAGPGRGRGAGLAPRRTRWGPAMGLPLVGPSGVGLGLRALRWFACLDPVTDASGFPYRPSSDGGLGRCTGAVSCGRRHRPFRSEDANLGSHACVPLRAPLGGVGRAALRGAF